MHLSCRAACLPLHAQCLFSGFSAWMTMVLGLPARTVIFTSFPTTTTTCLLHCLPLPSCCTFHALCHCSCHLYGSLVTVQRTDCCAEDCYWTVLFALPPPRRAFLCLRTGTCGLGRSACYCHHTCLPACHLPLLTADAQYCTCLYCIRHAALPAAQTGCWWVCGLVLNTPRAACDITLRMGR